MYRVIVYIDGSNLYHAIDDLGDDSLKWLDLWQLSEAILRKDQKLEAVKYFSAYATWRADSYKRQRDFIKATEAQGVTTIMGRFKEKKIKCQATCKEEFYTHEEKETDVNIGSHLIADALTGKFDTALIISADTDLAAVIRLARSMIDADKRICTVAPPKRFARARELEHLFEITKGKVRKCQLPDKVKTQKGIIMKPKKYL